MDDATLLSQGLLDVRGVKSQVQLTSDLFFQTGKQSDQAGVLRDRGRSASYMHVASSRGAIIQKYYYTRSKISTRPLTPIAKNNSRSPLVISSAMCSGSRLSRTLADFRRSFSSCSGNDSGGRVLVCFRPRNVDLGRTVDVDGPASSPGSLSGSLLDSLGSGTTMAATLVFTDASNGEAGLSSELCGRL
jgi:hypothetical protein